MNNISELMPQFTIEFAAKVCTTLNDMMNLNYTTNIASFSIDPFFKANGTVVFIHFGGTIQGDCLLIIPDSTYESLITSARKSASFPEQEDGKIIIEELMSEVLNTSVGRLVPLLEKEIELLSYMPPIIVFGDITFPKVASNSITIVGDSGEITCVFALNMANIKIKQTLKIISDDLAVKTKQATVDALTGLKNRMYFDEMYCFLFNQAFQMETSLSIIIVDIDNLKYINDTFGHQTGDQVLVLVADALMSSVRKDDIPCRYGGDEFVVLLPNTKLTETKNIANRIRSHLQKTNIEIKAGAQKISTLTISMGIAQNVSNKSSDYLFNSADKALLTAKQLGRNRVKYFLPDSSIGDL